MFLRLERDEFENTVGLLTFEDYECMDLKCMDLKPSYCSDSFERYDLVKLEKFCKENPEYHILSNYSGSMFINFISPWATIYMLGKGDKNPDLIYYKSNTLKAYERRELFRLLRIEGFTLRDALELDKARK